MGAPSRLCRSGGKGASPFPGLDTPPSRRRRLWQFGPRGPPENGDAARPQAPAGVLWRSFTKGPTSREHAEGVRVSPASRVGPAPSVLGRVAGARGFVGGEPAACAGGVRVAVRGDRVGSPRRAHSGRAAR